MDGDEQTAAVSRADRTAYIRNLLYAASRPSGAVRLVITLRADFYHRCADDDGLRAALADCQEYIGAMNMAELREVVNNGRHSSLATSCKTA